jgi:hypothetical protein
MSEYTDNTANELADLALAEAEACGEDKIVDRIGEILGASSQSLEEAYLTAIRVRRAEKRARTLLLESAAKRAAAAQIDDMTADGPTEIV